MSQAHRSRVFSEAGDFIGYIGSVEAVREYVANGGNVDGRTPGGLYPNSLILHAAIRADEVAVVEYLLQMKANKDLKDDDGNDALRLAKAVKADERIIAMLGK